MSYKPVRAPTALSLSPSSLQSLRCQEGEGLRALTIALDFSGGGGGGGGAFGASGNFSGARYQGGTVWHTDKRQDEAVTKVYFRLSELPAASYHGQISLVWHLTIRSAHSCNALVCKWR